MAQELKIKLSADGSAAVNGINQVSNGLQNLGRNATEVSQSVSNLAKSFVAAFGVAEFTTKLVAVQRQFDVLNASLVTMTGSAANAKIAFSAIQEFAQKTPYSLQEVTQAFVKMKSLGLDASEKALTSYGNTASAMGKSLSQMIEAVADASTSEFERLKEFGIKAKQQGDTVALTFQGVTTKIGNNAEEITQYLQKIGENQFASAMAERAKTLDGAISNLADGWDNLFLTISQNNSGGLIYDSVKLAAGAVADLTTIIKAMGAAAGENAQQTGAMKTVQEGIATTFETVAVLGVNVAYVMRGIGTELGGLAAQAAAVATLDFSGAKFIGEEMKRDADAARVAVDALTAKILNARKAAESSPSAAGLGTLGSAVVGDQGNPGDSIKSIQEAAEKARKDYLRTLEQDAEAEATIIKEQLKFYAARDAALQGYLDDETKRNKSLAETTERMNDELITLGMSSEELANYRAQKLEASAASELLAAVSLDEAAAHLDLQRVLPDVAQKYRELAAAKREAAGELVEQAAVGTQLAAKRAAVDAAKDSGKAWEKFADDIERSLTDSLYRSFESGKGFGETFVNSLKATLKAAALKLVIQYAVSGTGNLVGTLGNAAINGVLGTSGNNGGAGTNWLGTASNASTLYNGYNTAQVGYQYLAGSMSGANAAGTVYANATGTGIDGLLATNGAYGTAAAGEAGAAGGSTSGLGASAVGWIAAIVMGMYMSGEAWQKGIRWENYAKDDDAQKYDAEVWIRALHDEPARAIFGDKFVDSKFYAVMGGGSLSAQIHGAVQKGLWGGDWAPDGSDSRLSGNFSDTNAFTNGRIAQDFSKDGGWFGDDEKETRTQAISDGLDGILDDLYRNVRNTYVMAGAVYDDNSIAEKVKSFTLNVANLSGSKLEASVGVISVQLAESMGRLLFPSIDAMKKAGEGWSDAFARALTQTSSVTRLFTLMGKNLIGVFSRDNADRVLKMSDNLVNLFGSVENLNAGFTAYYTAFYTPAEQLTQAWADMGVEFGKMNLAMPDSIAGFRDVVDGLDLSTESGQATFAALVKLSPAFAATAASAAEMAKTTAANLLSTFTAKGALTPALNLTATSLDSLATEIGDMGQVAGSISSIFLDATSPALSFYTGVSRVGRGMTNAQIASGLLADEIAAMKSGAQLARLDIKSLGIALLGANYAAPAAAVNRYLQSINVLPVGTSVTAVNTYLAGLRALPVGTSIAAANAYLAGVKALPVGTSIADANAYLAGVKALPVGVTIAAVNAYLTGVSALPVGTSIAAANAYLAGVKALPVGTSIADANAYLAGVKALPVGVTIADVNAYLAGVSGLPVGTSIAAVNAYLAGVSALPVGTSIADANAYLAGVKALPVGVTIADVNAYLAGVKDLPVGTSIAAVNAYLTGVSALPVGTSIEAVNNALNGVDTTTFIATIGLVFESLAGRIKGVIDGIAAERVAVREAALQIINPTVMSKAAITRQIAAINVALPSNAGVLAASRALRAVDAKQALLDTWSGNRRPAASAATTAATAFANAQAGSATARAALLAAQGAGLATIGRTNTTPNTPALLGEGTYANMLGFNSSGAIAAREAWHNASLAYTSAEAQRGTAQRALAAANEALATYDRANKQPTTQAVVDTAKAAANLAAQNAQLAYADALQDFAVDAGKSVSKLTRLREETVKYYEAQKALADLMGTSAAGLRATVADYRYSQMTDVQQYHKLQTDYATAYTMGLSTSGETLAGYGDKMNALLPTLLEKARSVLSDAAYSAFAGSTLARAEAIAAKLETTAPKNYAADSLTMLNSIDATLVALDASSKSAEKIIADAIKAGSDRTADGLRAVIAALAGDTVPAFAAGGLHTGGVRLVGEYGPELEVTGPARIFSASQTRAMLSGGGGNADVVAELRALRRDNEMMRAELRAIASTNARMARQADRAEQEGVLVRTDADTPLKVETV